MPSVRTIATLAKRLVKHIRFCNYHARRFRCSPGLISDWLATGVDVRNVRSVARRVIEAPGKVSVKTLEAINRELSQEAENA